MSLIHWWPLNGDTQDKIGNNNLRYVNNSGKIVTNTSGKLGKCYERTATGSSDLLRSTEPMKVFEEESICAWIYVSQHAALNTANGVVTNHDHNTNSGLGIGVYSTDGSNYYVSINAGNGSSRVHSTYWGQTNIKGAWHHVCLVSDGSKIRMYVDGKEDRAAVSYSVYSKADYLDIFNWSTGYYTQTNYRPACKVCDVRIYDHALSQAEVKELSKALVVHYTFDDILAEPTTNLVTQGALSWSKLTVNVSSSHINGVYTITTTTANNSAASGQIRANFPLAILTTGATYYFSCKYRVISGTGTFTLSDWCDSSLTDKKTKDCGDFYELSAKCYTTRTYNSTYRFLDCNLSANSVIEVWDVQLQTNDKVTPYVLGTRESMLYNETGLIQPTYNTNTNLIQDSSSGIFSLSCTGNTIINTPIIGDITSGATISCWIKVPTYPSANAIVFADYNSQLAFGFYGTQNAIISCGGYSAPYISNIKSNWINGWNHVVVTRNNSGTISCYLNGVKLSTTGSNNWSSTSGYSTIGGRYNGSYTTYFTGYVDDYRVYHTLLSDTDIQDLYKTKAYITNMGDIETHQFIEGKTQAQVTSKYCFEADEFYEDFEVNSGYERVEYIEFSETQYIDTGLAFTDVNIPIIIEADIVKTALSGNDCLAGCGNGAWNGPVMLNCHNGTCEFGVNGYATASDGSGSIAANERLIIRAELGTKKEEHFWYKNGQKINLGTKAYNDRTSSSSTLYIGAFHVGTSFSIASGSCWIGRIYSFKVWYGGFSRILVPAKRKSDNAFGLYDMAEHNFYPNIGGGSLSGGPIINISEAKIYKDQHILGRNIIEI